MCDIIFRGFHPCDGPDTIVVDREKVKGRWVEGYIVKHPSAIQIGNDYSPWYIHVPPVDPDDNGGVFNVLPSTVGQYTGLTDKNGKRIFEGDRISRKRADWDDYPEQHIVRWENDSCGFEPFSDSEENCHHCGGGLPPDDCEVIGTVFDEGALNAKT